MPKGKRDSKKRSISRPSRPMLKRGTGPTRVQQSHSTPTFRRRIRTVRPIRPVWRPHGGSYRRRYRAQPISSGACIFLFVFFALLLLIEFAPSFTFEFAPDYSFILLLAIVIGIFIIVTLFITKLDLGGDDDRPERDEPTTIIERERVLVVCPYCGTKNEQGRSHCINCDGAL